MLLRKRLRYRDFRANISAYAEKAMLDWVAGGATPTRPGTWALGVSLGAPSSTSGSEVGTGSGYTRQTVLFAPAASPGGSATNSAAVTFGPFLTAQSLSGLQVWDTILTLNSGNMLWYGTLSAARTVASGDSLVIGSGQLTISLA